MLLRNIRSRRVSAFLLTIVVAAGVTVVGAATGTPARAAGPDVNAVALDLAPFASGLASPVAIAFRPGDQRMYVAEKSGKLRIVDTDGTVESTHVLTVSVAGGDEQGLLGVAFSPNGGKVYVDYVDPSSFVQIVEYTMSGDVATSPRTLLSIDHTDFPNHNGGQLVIGPDGDLYIGTGDGGSGGDPLGNGQSTNALLGKILRIDPTPSGSLPYTIPSDNPFFGQAGKRGEIWMWGLRNPWRFSFDSATGKLWIADVGQNLYEEVDVAAAGQSGTNFGWNLREGFHPYNGGAKPPGAQDPEFELAHSDGYCAVIGGFVYRGSTIPNLNGAYVYSDLCHSNIAAYDGTNNRDFAGTLDQPSTFGQGPSGELYVAALDGTISKLVPGVVPTVSVGDQKMLEGDSGTRKMTFTATLSKPGTKTVTAQYAVTGLTATGGKGKKPGVDFKAASGKVSFKKGTISKAITVQVYGDTAVEPNETFAVTLSNPSNGYSLERDTGTGTILNDDAGSAALGIGDAAVVRASNGHQTLVLPVVLTGKASASFTVSYNVSAGSASYSSTPEGGGDFGGATSGTLKFGKSTGAVNIAIPVWPHTQSGPDKSFTVTISGGGVPTVRATGTATILDQ